jgi:two-component system chemotaxis response regulator CheY
MAHKCPIGATAYGLCWQSASTTGVVTSAGSKEPAPRRSAFSSVVRTSIDLAAGSAITLRWREDFVMLHSVDDDLIGPRVGGPAQPRVLVVDDDPVHRTLCVETIEKLGLKVIEAEDGRRALARARFEQPDLIVTDIAMPGLDGFELAEALGRSKRTKEIPVVFITGESGTEHEARARELGAIAYVSKPFDPSLLTSIVAGVMARFGRGDDLVPA